MIRVKPSETAGEPVPQVRDHDLDLTQIKLDQSAQPRESLNNDRIAEYAEAMKAGDQFPPLTVFHDGSTYWLADGFHRHYAAQHAGQKHIRCYVRQGGFRDAILYSVGANAKHGLARSDEDKKRAVMRLLDDAEWSTWTDRDIAKRCHVSHPFVAKVRAKHVADTGNASSMERTYVHPKTGKPTTMKTAGINASRTQFQAKASEDNGSITGRAGAVTGEASRLASGRTDAGEAASVDLPTISEAACEADEIVAERNIFDELVALWKEADAGIRQDFKAYITGSEFVAKIGLRQEASDNAGGGDVDRSATRASSAVEVGATNSPDGATKFGSHAETHNSHHVGRVSDAQRQGAVAAQAPDTNSQSAASTAEAVAGIPHAPLEPPATANPFTNPRCQHPETCHLAHSRNECFDCNLAWSKRPKDEQVRLWAEAVQAARAA